MPRRKKSEICEIKNEVSFTKSLPVSISSKRNNRNQLSNQDDEPKKHTRSKPKRSRHGSPEMQIKEEPDTKKRKVTTRKENVEKNNHSSRKKTTKSRTPGSERKDTEVSVKKVQEKSAPSNSKLKMDDLNDVKIEHMDTDGEWKSSSETTSFAASCSKEMDINDKSDSSESEWEEVEEEKTEEQKLQDYEPNIPKEGVEITIDCPDLKIRRRQKKAFDEMEYIRLHVNRQRKEAQLNVHKAHLLCLLGHALYVNNILNSSLLKSIALSITQLDLESITGQKKINKIDIDGIERLQNWYQSTFDYDVASTPFLDFCEDQFLVSFEKSRASNVANYNLMFIILARILGFSTRFCISLYPITHKAHNLIKKPNTKKEPSCDDKNENSKSKIKTQKKKSEKKKTALSQKEQNKSVIKNYPQLTPHKKYKDSSDENCDDPKKPEKKKTALSHKEQNKSTIKNRPQRMPHKSYKDGSDENCDDPNDKDFSSDGDDFIEDFRSRLQAKKNINKTHNKKTPNRRVLSSDSEPSSPDNSTFDNSSVTCWAEIFSKPDNVWVSVDCVGRIFNKPYKIEKFLPKPVVYIIACDNNSYLKDVTRRYCPEYMTLTAKLRADSSWWEETLEPFAPPNSKLDKEEEKKLEMLMINKPLPNTVAGFKNHPLYALKRHLLKFEALYPPDVATVGFVRGEPVYPREAVAQLHSRETWLKEARVVRIGEVAYKVVKARPKWDKMAGVVKTDLPLEIFGFWQTEPYEPPIAVDGKIPRNEYGNVELFKPCMLPRGTVHLPIPGLNRIAKKLGIDCCPAVVGFDGHKGSIHPVFDGFIVCEEFKDTILAAWDEEQENAKKREEEKRDKRIYGNWKKLIKGLLIRERIRLKYNTK